MRLTTTLFALAVGLSPTLYANAAQIQVTFSGVVIRADTSSTPHNNFVLGSEVTGNFVYESATPADPPIVNQFGGVTWRHYGAMVSAYVRSASSGMELFFDADLENYASVYEANDASKDGVYFQVIDSFDPFPFTSEGQFDQQYFKLNMRSTSSELFTSSDLPNPLPGFGSFDEFRTLYLEYQLEGETANGNVMLPKIEITSYTVIPEPATPSILIVGLAMALCRRPVGE